LGEAGLSGHRFIPQETGIRAERWAAPEPARQPMLAA
jgi:hypothetical protein